MSWPIRGGGISISGSTFQIPGVGPVPAFWRKRASSIMYLGDSIFNKGTHLPNTPIDRCTRPVNSALPNINAGGLFIVLMEAAAGCPTGNGTLRFEAATNKLFWTAFGDTEGPGVIISSARCFYTLESNTVGFSLYIGTIARLIPVVDKTDTFLVNSVITMTRQNNAGTTGIACWTQALLGNPFSTSLSYTIPTSRASDWRAARATWENVYTDITDLFLGTNDIQTGSQAEIAQILTDLEWIATRRQAIGSLVKLTCLLPYDARSATLTAAAMQVNAGIRALGEKLNCDVADGWPCVAAPMGTGGYAPVMSPDGLHPGSRAAYLIASRTEVPILRKYVEPIDPTQFAGTAYNASTAPQGNLLTNGVMAGTGGTIGARIVGAMPNSWTAAFNVGSVMTAEVIPAADARATPISNGYQGNWTTCILDNTGGVTHETFEIRSSSVVAAGNYAPGDKIVYEGLCQISGTGIGFLYVTTTMTAQTGVALNLDPSTTSGSGMEDLGGDLVTIPFRSMPMIIETGGANMRASISLGMRANGRAILRFGPLTIRKV